MAVSELLMLLISLTLAYLFSEIFKKLFGLPRVVGQITAGIILGLQVVRDVVFPQTNSIVVSFLANLGIVMLFYYAGLEMNFRAFKKNMKKSVLVSIFNTLFPLVIGFLVMKYIFSFSSLVSFVIGICISVSAQAVAVDILEELRLVRTKIGRLIITAGAVDDVLELLFLTVLLSLFHISLGTLPLHNLLINILFFVAIIFISRFLLVPSVLKFFDKEHTTTARFTGGLLILLFFASLGDWLGVGSLLGALAAGMVVRQTIFRDGTLPNWEEHNIASSLHIIAFGFLIPLFFVWVGVNVHTGTLLENIPLIIVLVIISTIGTVGGTLLAVVLSKGTVQEGWLLAWGLNAKGDVELIIGFLALELGVITQQIFGALVMMSLITTIISPIVFTTLVHKYEKRMKW